eukprot:764340-Hanusia_phi.AAC.1
MMFLLSLTVQGAGMNDPMEFLSSAFCGVRALNSPRPYTNPCFAVTEQSQTQTNTIFGDSGFSTTARIRADDDRQID